jgi:hypothetical protein
MRARVRSQWLPKRGNHPHEYEDAFRPATFDHAAGMLRCAVADGATETSFSGIWANQLVSAYCRGQLGPRRWKSTLERLQARWKDAVATRELPWYAEEKARAGAFSAIVGITISVRSARPARVVAAETLPEPDSQLLGASTDTSDRAPPASTFGYIRWSALGLGDSCVLHVRDRRLIHSFPLSASADFSNRPRLLSSNAAANGALNGAIRRASGAALRGDTFLLATDALAFWALSMEEEGEDVWEELTAMARGDADSFGIWVDELRDRRGLRNDDVTLLYVEIA